MARADCTQEALMRNGKSANFEVAKERFWTGLSPLDRLERFLGKWFR
jgi:hypothetical protein